MRGFTLIELLVVIALTVVLMTLLFGPLVAAFQYTSRAQTLSAAQDGQRLLLREISRDLQSAAGIRDTQSKYVNALIIQKSDPKSNTGTQTLVHMYNAYTDIVPPRGNCQDAASLASGVCNGGTLVTDPTTDQAVVLKKDSTGASYGESPGIVTPLAPSTSFTRYFIGMRYPYSPLTYTGGAGATASPYNNLYENSIEQSSTDQPGGAGTTDYSQSDVVKQQLNNTYVLYAANVSPYTKSSDPSVASTVNTKLFQASGGKPYLDDPDFFRIVQDSDLLPQSNPKYAAGTVVTYGDAGETDAHNTRVYNWSKVSHMVLSGRDYDLLAYARAGGKIDYGIPPTGPVNPLSGVEYNTAAMSVGKYTNAANSPNSSDFMMDTTNLEGGKPVLRIRPTFLIAPGGVTNEAAQAQVTDYASQGVQATGNSVQQINYIPSVYATSQQQLQGAPSFGIDAGSNGKFTTRQAEQSDITATIALANGGTVALGDLIELDATSAVVYDITQKSEVTSATSYVAASFNSTSGQLSFAVPAMPPTTSTTCNADTGNSMNTWWCARLEAVDPTGEMYLDLGDTSVFTGSPLAKAVTPPFTVVVNSERVRGPDRTSGPAKYAQTPSTNPISYPLVSYTRVPLGTPVGPNQYSIMYYYNPSGGTTPSARILLGPQTEWSSMLTQGGTTLTAQNTILVSYNVQNNSQPGTSGVTQGPSAATITASYASANTMQITAGIRVYDPVSRLATFITNSETATVGNGTR
jgi:prepilin-type N-terminal cleavage/methylation domain-containing protein